MLSFFKKKFLNTISHKRLYFIILRSTFLNSSDQVSLVSDASSPSAGWPLLLAAPSLGWGPLPPQFPSPSP